MLARYPTSGGRRATERLAELIAHAQANDPLAPVTVVVPSNYAALSARRTLAAQPIGGLRGLANVAFVTVNQLAQRLVPQRAEPPLTPMVLAAAVRAELRSNSIPMFLGVGGHRATEQALCGAYAELSRAHPDTLAALAQSGHARTQAVLGFARGVAERVAGFADDERVARDAIAAVPMQAADLGFVIHYLLDELTPAQRALLGHIAEHNPSAEVAFEFDAGRSALTRISSAIDSDDEVRQVLRHVLRLIEAGTPANRIGILYTSPDPYARIVREQLSAADIPYNGPGIRGLADSVFGRVVRGVLALERADLSRDALIDLICSAPADLPATEWDRLSRQAGVLGGAADWRSKLERLGAELRAELARLEAAEMPRGWRAVRERRLHAIDELARFAHRWALALERARALSCWSDLVEWLAVQLREFTLPPGWPARETDAECEIMQGLLRLAQLDDIEPVVDVARFAAAVESLLDAVSDRAGRFGEGVLVLPVALVPGVDLDAVFILGAAEGYCPLTRREDALLPDAERARACHADLTTHAQRTAQEHRAFLAAIAAGTNERSVSYPRGDGRSGRGRLPSRWLLSLAGSQLGRSIASEQLAQLNVELIDTSLSFLDGLRRAAVPATAAERELQLIERHGASGFDVTRHHLCVTHPALGRGYALMNGRRAPELTRFDGNIGASLAQPLTRDRPLSPSRLERWAFCPMRYLLGDVLGLSELPKPEDALAVRALDRGNLLHEILERLLGDQLNSTHIDYGRLGPIAAERFADYEARGLTGRPMLWQIAQTQIATDLTHFSELDARHRSEHRAQTASVEFEFGFSSDPLIVRLPTGRELAFRGRIDRVDRIEGVDDGSGRAWVIDYKAGSSRQIGRRLAGDPVLSGTKLQLPIYAAAAREAYGTTEVAGRYWFLADRSTPWADVALDEATEARALEAIATIVEGIEGGVFPAFPLAWNAYFGTFDNCRFCDFDRLCPRDRDVTWAAKRDDSSVAVFLRLDPDTEDSEDVASEASE